MNFGMISFNLHKANTEFLLSILGLTRDYRCRWLQVTCDYHANARAQSRTELTQLSQKSGPEAAFGLPIEVCARLVGSGMNGTLSLHEPFIETQTAFMQGLQQALHEWRATVVGLSDDS